MDILMPQLGETVAEGKITKWFKAAGDAVKPGDNLFEIETDKVSMEVPATSSGVLSEIRVQAGEVALVGAVVAIVGDKGGVASSAPVQNAAPAQAKVPAKIASTPAAAALQNFVAQPQRQAAQPFDIFNEVRTPLGNYGPARLANGVQITPLARRLAKEAGVDPAQLRGSGPHGRVVAKDVATGAGARPGSTPPLVTGASAAQATSASQVKALFPDTPFTEVPLDGMRRTIATRLIAAKQSVPHFYLTMDLDLTALLAAREMINAAAPKGADGRPGYKVSINDFVIKAFAAALKRVPAANAVWAEDRILRFEEVDIGIAVALEDGLITPVLRKADSKPLAVIATDMHDLAARAREKKLTPAEYQGGAAAISNLGMYGVREFSAIINPPHATILAVGAARRAPVETDDGGVKFVSQMSVTLSCDHRVIDGAVGAELLAAFKNFIEQPVTMLV